jgi:Cdc6-like AAA superfamily ATPase
MPLTPKHEEQLDRLFDVFKSTQAEIRPHFILTGPSGSGKSYTIQQLADKHDLGYLEVNKVVFTKQLEL